MNRIVLCCLLIVSNALPAAAKARDYLKRPAEWFSSDEGRQRLENMLSHQDKHGCWPKNFDTTENPYQGDPNKLRGTFDNSATLGELHLLARAYRVTEKEKFKEAFLRGLQCILDAQYPNGGWPQYPHASSGYSQHITFNDGTMVGLMEFLREVGETERYEFVPQAVRQQASEAFDRGVDCILQCQIKVDGQLTAWCAQHDRGTLEPRGARSYEHPSLSGGESAGIVCLLMSLEDPSDQVRESILAAVEWYKRSRLDGIRYEKKDGDRKIIRDPKASPLWARFYDIATNRPIFSGRDGVIKYDMDQIEAERRNGYSWYVTSGTAVEKCFSNYHF
jgi:pectate lyase